MEYKGTIKLTADVAGVEWGGTNKYIKVHPDGTVESLKSFIKTGTATVTATLGDKTAVYEVKVKPSVLQWLYIIVLFGWIWY